MVCRPDDGKINEDGVRLGPKQVSSIMESREETRALAHRFWIYSHVIITTELGSRIGKIGRRTGNKMMHALNGYRNVFGLDYVDRNVLPDLQSEVVEWGLWEFDLDVTAFIALVQEEPDLEPLYKMLAKRNRGRSLLSRMAQDCSMDKRGHMGHKLQVRFGTPATSDEHREAAEALGQREVLRYLEICGSSVESRIQKAREFMEEFRG